MKNKKIIVGLVSAFSLLGCLVGCGNTSSSITSQSNSSQQSSSADGAPTKVEINFWHTFGQGIQDELANAISDFHDLLLATENVDIKISPLYQGGYDDIHNWIMQGFRSGNVPTISVAYPDHVADYIDAEGTDDGKYVVKLDDLINDEEIGLGKEEALLDETGIEDMVPVYFEEGTQYAKEGTYSIPLLKSSEVMFYNFGFVKDAMKFYKPEITGDDEIKEFISTMTWDDFMGLNKCIMDKKAEDSNFLPTVKFPAYYDSDSNLFITKMFQNNIPYTSVQEDGKGVIEFAKEENIDRAKAEVTNIKASYDQGLIKTKGTEGEYGSNFFKTGECVFSIGSSGGAGYVLPNSDIFEVDVSKVPFANDNPTYVSQGPTICLLRNPGYTDAENDIKVKYAWKFIKYLLNPEVNLSLCLNGSKGYAPVRKSSYLLPDYVTFLEESGIYADCYKVLQNDVNNNYINTKTFRGCATLRDEVGGIITQVLKKSVSVDKAFTDCVNNVIDELKPLDTKKGK